MPFKFIWYSVYFKLAGADNLQEPASKRLRPSEDPAEEQINQID